MIVTYLPRHYSDIGTIISARELYERGGKAKLISTNKWYAQWNGCIYEWRKGHEGYALCLVCVDDPHGNYWESSPLNYPIEDFPLEIVE